MYNDEQKSKDELLYELRALRLENLRLAEQLNESSVEFVDKRKLAYFENTALIDQTIRRNTNLELMMNELMGVMRQIFQCDQAWLLHPCDPDALHWRVPFRSVSENHPIHFGPDEDLPSNADLAENCRLALASEDPVPLGMKSHIKDVPVEARESAAKSALLIALHPKVGRPWLLGLHQCAAERTWTHEEKQMFQDISGRVSDALSTILFYRSLEENQERLKHLSYQLFRSQENERKQLATEIHDELGQPVLALKIGIENGLYHLKDADEAALKPFQSASNLARSVVQKMRHMQSALYPPTLSDFGVTTALSGFFKDFENIYSMDIRKEIRVSEDAIPESLRVPVFRIAQEALYNAGKYSRGSEVRVTLDRIGQKFFLEVADNGVGFNPDIVIRYPDERLGLGLTSMRERVEMTSGLFEIESEQDKGTTIRCSWDLSSS